jgi:Tol biopolymer transport system component
MRKVNYHIFLVSLFVLTVFTVSGSGKYSYQALAHENTTHGITTRVSVASDGTESNNHSYLPSISADGRYIAFRSDADNLVPGDTNSKSDVFVRDRETGMTTRVSVATDGSQANGNSGFFGISISFDGRFVAFDSEASNLVPGDTNQTWDVFVHDRQTSITTRVSVSSDGIQGNSESISPVLSADGRFVAFGSDATNLVPGVTNQAGDIFMHDRWTGETTRVSVANDGSQFNGASFSHSISSDGRYVAFVLMERHSDWHPTGGTDVLVHDRLTGETTIVSVSSDGTYGNGWSGFHGGTAISGNGRFIAFGSDATNLVPGDTNDVIDIFVHDRQTGETTRVSVASDGTQGDGNSVSPSLSYDGQFVAFQSFATNLVLGDTNNAPDIFLHDRQNGETTRVSVTRDGLQGNNSSYRTSISAEGRYVAFASDASNLVPEDANGVRDIFVHDRGQVDVPCVLTDIPVFLQGWPTTPDSVPGNRPYWYNHVYGRFSDGDQYNTIGRWGCNLTSNAMIINYFANRSSVSFQTDPGMLNIWLRDNNFQGYTERSGVRYSSVIEYARNNNVHFNILINRDRNDDLVDSYLCSGNPVMLGVQTLYGNHFVVATGITELNGEKTYLLNDPIWGETTLLESYNNQYHSAYYYFPSHWPGGVMGMQFSVYSPVHLVIVDPLGRKAGYDPITKQRWSEIPGSSYVEEKISGPDGSNLPDSKVLYIPRPINGEYKLKVIGYDIGEYGLEIFKLDGIDTEISWIEGEATIGSIDEIVIQFQRAFELIYLPITSRE